MAYQKTVTAFDPLTGQRTVWERLSLIASSSQVGSAYLLTGPPGSGKEALALAFGRYLNCEAPDTLPCDRCPSCQRFKQLQHEKLKLVFPLPAPKKKTETEAEFDSSSLGLVAEAIKKKADDPFYKIQIPKANRILIQSIRDLRKTLYLKSDNTGRKMVLFFDAHLLSAGQGEAANALLKILEEPPGTTTLMLVTDHKELLLPTILSRCQHLGAPRLNDDFVGEWLLNNGANGDNVSLMIGLSSGNIHQTRFLLEQPLAELIALLDKLVQTVTSENPDGWRSFTQTYAKLANQDPASFRFHFRLLSLWFRSACRLMRGMPDLLHKTELKPGMDTFVTAYPHADLFEVALSLEETASAIAQNLYMPLILINLLLDVQKTLHS